MMTTAKGALAYFGAVFGAGFLLGAIRVLWLEPLLGSTVATLCEMPIMLAVIFWAARRIPVWLRIGTLAGLAGVGLGALVLQQVADIAVGLGLRGMSPPEMLAHYATPAGLLYAAAQVAFAAMPAMLHRAGLQRRCIP